MRFVSRLKGRTGSYLDQLMRNPKRWIEVEEYEIIGKVKQLRETDHEILKIGSKKRLGKWIRIYYIKRA